MGRGVVMDDHDGVFLFWYEALVVLCHDCDDDDIYPSICRYLRGGRWNSKNAEEIGSGS